MKNAFLKMALMVAAFSCWTPAAMAVGLTVSPSTISNDSVGKITLAITGLTSGQIVVVEKYADLNGNGAVDAGEPLVQGCLAIDGLLPSIGGVRNLNVPGDEDGAANGQIRAELSYPSIDPLTTIAGKYLIRVSDLASGFAPVTQSFEVTQKVLPQGVSGKITALDTGAPLAYVMVALVPYDSDPVTGTVTDASGNYTLFAVPGDYTVLPLAAGYVGGFEDSITVSAGTIATWNLALPAATYTISGKVKDSFNAELGIPGIFIQVESDSGQFVAGFSKLDGTYSIGVRTGAWWLSPSCDSLAQVGYVGWWTGTDINVTSADVKNRDLPVERATALIYGTVKDPLNQPVNGIDIWADDQVNRQYETSGRTIPVNADYCVGVRPGTWWVGPDSATLSPLGYFCQGTEATVSANQAVRADLIVTPVTAHLIGQVVDNLGEPLSDIGIYASDHQNMYSDATTDQDGNFNIGVTGGTWYLQLSSESAEQDQLVSPQLRITLADGETHGNIVFVVQNQTAQISGYVRDSGGQPVSANVYANALIGEVSYASNAQTDGGGNYWLPVIDGTWQVGLNANGFTNPDQVTVVISGSSATRNFTLSKTPAIYSEPSDQTVNVGQIATFSIGASSNGSLDFLWQVSTNDGGNWNDLSDNATYHNVTSSTLSVTSNAGLNGYRYRCLAINSFGSTPSDSALLTVGSSLVITSPDWLPDGEVGSSYSIQLNASGGQPPYHWYLPGGTASLPPGTMNLSDSGILSGTPSTAGTYNFTLGVFNNDWSGLVTQSMSLTIIAPSLTPLETWRQTQFGDPANSGAGADLNDFEKDGIVNLLEFAFGLNPKQDGSGQIPRAQRIGNNFVMINFSQPASVSGITYGAEWSSSLQAGGWHPVADSGTGNQHIFSVPVGTNKTLFMRLKITSP